jgi:Mycothiol maleylpyruvate isomerase N-terminal domain
MRSRVPADEVLAMFEEGVGAFVAEAGRLDVDGWARPACGEWSATELARHVLSVIGWYHDWLDRAEAGDASPAFPVEDLDEQAARSLAEIGDVPGPEATARFAAEAARYADRLEERWDLAYGYPRGTVTAGLHAGMAAVEWHVHCWDLATSAGHEHVPAHPDRLFLAAADCQAAVTGGLRGAAVERLAPLGSRMKPWRELLQRMGRA